MSRSAASIATWQPTFGAVPERGHTTFSVWAPGARSVTLCVEAADGTLAREVRLEPRGDGGLHQARVGEAGDGTRYRYRLDGRPAFPDPASRYQPDGVHAASAVVDWTRFRWTDDAWHGARLEDLVIYELHVGTFTPAGSFEGVTDRLGYLADLGVTAIELMPIAAFPGRRNWGYDGVAIFAPSEVYGGPHGLRDLVDAAHRAGLAVLIDVVYNHLGPDGAYLSAFSPQFFTPRHQSPWGDGVNLDGDGGEYVRRFLIENALHWVHEYHADGLRLDATHALVDDSGTHVLAELSDAVHGLDLGRPVHIIAEDERNLARLVRTRSAGGFGLDGLWADDFHHEMHRLLTGEREGYYRDFSGSVEDLATTIARGWFYSGQVAPSTGEPRGSRPDGLAWPQFVFCLQNHDQIGNRAMGERLSSLADAASCRAAAAVLLLAPETPMLFMGEEWAASTPFLYFTDHNDELGRLVTEGRRREFARFSAFSRPAVRERIPDPQSQATFDASRLRWNEVEREPHASMRRLYAALIALRKRIAPARREDAVALPLDARTLAISRVAGRDRLVLVARFAQGGLVVLPPHVLEAARGFDIMMTTEEPRFARDASPPRVSPAADRVAIDFARPSAVVLRSAA